MNAYLALRRSEKMDIGQYNRLEVNSITSTGIFLTDGIDEVLMPAKHAPGGLRPGNSIDVFVYLDNENRPIATSIKPNAVVGDFVFLTVKDVNEHGAFLDWGISKDLFVPYAEQRGSMKIGEEYLVHVFIDDHSGRIAATQRWSNYLSESDELSDGDEVELLIAEETEMGFRAIINNSHEGLLYRNEVFEDIQPGDKRRGFIRLIRPDGKIDLRLRPEGYAHVENTRHQILEYLKKHKGKIPLGDKSDATHLLNSWDE
ncbi:MAG: hypothetical protein IPP51_00305 [Bacteroidetes bacterium]|nr:hypothetical protein [Bacteroidota bacterium]